MEDPLHSDEPEAPDFELCTVKGKLVQPCLDLDRTSELIVEDDESDFGVAGER